jgi:hypothetical protein
MDHISYKFLRRITKNQKLVGKRRQATAMKVKTMPPAPDELPGLATQVQGCPSILERHLPNPE